LFKGEPEGVGKELTPSIPKSLSPILRRAKET
jgi:hypothetical protein